MLYVDRDTPLGVVVAEMSDRNIASVLVAGAGGISGIFSERDYLRKVAKNDLDPRELTVGDVMSRQVTFATEDMSLDSCLTMMADNNFRRLPVLRASGDTSALRKPTSETLGMMTSTLVIQTLARLYLGELNCRVDSATEEVRTQTVGDLMSAQGGDEFVYDRHTISHDSDTIELIDKMIESNVGSLAVMNGDVCVGVVSEREYIQQIAAKPYTAKGYAHQVVDIMRPASDVTFITPEQTVEEAMVAMAGYPSFETTRRHLPVVNTSDGTMLGMLSIRDIKTAVSVAAQGEEEEPHLVEWREEQKESAVPAASGGLKFA